MHAWKACVPKGTGGSNPPPSALPFLLLLLLDNVFDHLRSLAIGRILPIAVLPDYLFGPVLE